MMLRYGLQTLTRKNSIQKFNEKNILILENRKRNFKNLNVPARWVKHTTVYVQYVEY